jgi:CTP synthase (UTP-ammonia lyase)
VSLELFGREFHATAHHIDGEVRGAELSGHPFFAGVLFQPERKGLKGELPPLVRDFVGAIVRAKSAKNLIN